ALITGAFVERMKFSAYIIFTIAWVTIVYAPMAHWVWGGGWLGGFGVMDFAGGAVVHMNSGLAALAAAIIVGRRLRHGQEPMDSHNVPFVMLGASLLWFGWFGFNAGSALTAGGSASLAFMVTNTAAAAAALTWVGLSWHFSGKPSAVGAAAGAVAGLVAITPAAGFVGPMPAIVIGMGAGAFCFGAMFLIRRLRIDDSLDVFAVHGIGGTWGALATGIFVAVGTAGAFDLGDIDRLEQVGKQIVGIAVTWGWSFTLTAAILLAIKHTIGLRVDDTTEEQGLDIAIHGDEAYPGTFH
ncbi:MAG: ammonium transporter, partial [Chloroflexi bacterium]|nr:ammonium transporter [Chloroflexota bacterium]